jgi:CBS-domain-containing membrane protein
MVVSDIMTKEVITVGKDTPLKEAAGLLAKFHVHGMPVIDQRGKVEGIITESDFFSKDSSNVYLPTFLEFISREQTIGAKMSSSVEMEKKTTVKDVMTAECTSVGPDLPLKELIQLVKEKNFKTIPVVDDRGILVGIVSVFDIIKLL